jgi:hypothetical protein
MTQYFQFVLARQSVGAAFGVSGQLAAHGQSAAAAAVH